MKKNKLIFLAVLTVTCWQPVNSQVLKRIKDKVGQTGRFIEQTIDKEIENTKNDEHKTDTEEEVAVSILESYSMSTISAPNQNFESISIQLFRDLPRIGNLYTYDMGNKSLPDVSQRIAKYKEDRKEFQKYVALLEMKLRGNLYDEMDTNMPYDINQKRVGSRALTSTADPDWNSAACQISLLNIGKELISGSAYPRYFCNPNNKCNNNRGETLNWGGLSANEFEKIECFKNYISDNLSDLRSSANKITDEGYIVMLTTFESYDFQKGGFPINIYLTVSYDRSDFEPINGIGSKLKKENNQIQLIKMSSENAKELLNRNRNRRIYTVWKVKYHGLTEPKIMSPSRNPTRHFHLLSPVVELFEDEALTQKLGEITIE